MKNQQCFLWFLIMLFAMPLPGQIEWGGVGTTFKYNRERDIGGILEQSILCIRVDRDTMIQGNNCQILREENDAFGWNWSCDGSESIVYEEEGRVYFYYPATQTFGLLYDFNKGAGEEWQVGFFCPNEDLNGSYFSVQVDSVGAEMVDGVLLPTQYVSLADSTGWIFNYTKIYENLGSADHFFYEEEWFWTTFHDWIRGLRCYESPTGLLVRFDEVTDCDQLTNTSAGAAPTAEVLRMFPNPTTDAVTIAYKGWFHCQILTANGQEVMYSGQQQDQVVLSLSSLPSGVYIAAIKTSTSTLYRRIIKH